MRPKKIKKMSVKQERLGLPTWANPNTSRKRLQEWLCEGVPYQPDFTDNMNWRIFRIMAEFIEGFEFLVKLKREVTFFGSSREVPGGTYYRIAEKLGELCARAGYTVITGGGPGIMEAANKGASKGGGESVGLNIQLPQEQRQNAYVKSGMGFHYFFTRKVMLSASAQAYVFFPGGFGTLDELFEMVELIQSGKMSDQVPVILVGKEYWEPMMRFLKDVTWKKHKYVNQKDLGILNLVDSPEAAFKIIQKTKERVL